MPVKARRIPRRGRLIALAGLLCAAVLAAAVALGTGGGSAASSLRGAGFTTQYPAGWTLTVSQQVSAFTNYALGSTRHKLDALNIPAPGEIGITVTEYSLDRFAALADPAAAAQPPLALLPYVIGTPRLASSLAVITPLHATSLGGVPAAGITYGYTYGGIPNVQSDVVARHGTSIVSIEMDAEPALVSQAQPAMNRTVRAWQWRQSHETSPAGSPRHASRRAV